MRAMQAVAILTVVLGISPATMAETATERRLRRLEETVERANEEIRQLKRELQEERARKAAAPAPTKEEQAAGGEAKVAAAKPSFELPKWLERISLFGDVRVRHEGFYHQQHDDDDVATARNRERFRARVGLKYTHSDELSATIRLATGNPDDPISTNETFDGSFSRKHINLDWAFITFSPGQTFGLRPGAVNVTAGKFPVPTFRVGEMVFDDDLSPEGAYQSFAVLGKPMGALEQVNLHVLEWTFSEVSNGQDGWMIGGQVNPRFKLGDVVLEGGVAQYWWLNADQIAQELNSNDALANTNMVDVVLDDDGNPTIVGYRSAFNQTNLTLAATIPAVLCDQPLKLWTDYVYNWEAASDNRQGVQAGFKLGNAKKRGDWAGLAYYEYLGQEAAISAFTFSDFGFGGTNVQGPVVGLDYQLLDPITLSARSYFTTLIDRPANVRNNTMIRLQLDAQVKF